MCVCIWHESMSDCPKIVFNHVLYDHVLNLSLIYCCMQPLILMNEHVLTTKAPTYTAICNKFHFPLLQNISMILKALLAT